MLMGGAQGTATGPTAVQGDEANGTVPERISATAQKDTITPASTVLKTDFSSMVEVSIRIEELGRVEKVMAVAYTKCAQDPQWQELGSTESQEDAAGAPVFKKSFKMEFKVGYVRFLRVELYRIRDPLSPEDLAAQKLLGTLDATVAEVLMARRQTQSAGWLVRDLQPPLEWPQEPISARGCLFAEEDVGAKQVITFTMRAKGLSSTDFWKGRADAYCILHRTSNPGLSYSDEEQDVECTPVYRSEVVRKTNYPKWKRVEFSAAQVCNNQLDQDIIIEVHDWFRVQSPRYIGECILNFSELARAFRNNTIVTRPICVVEGMRTHLLRALTATKTIGDRSSSGSRPASKLSMGSSLPARSRTGSRTANEGTNMASRRMLHSSKDSRDSRSSHTSRPSLVTKTSSIKSIKSTGSVSRSSGMVASVTSSASSPSKSSKGEPFGKVVGQMLFEDVGAMRTHTFLDYIRGGLELKMGVAIDLTRSNADPIVANSLHSMSSMNGTAETAYATAIRAVGEVMRSYIVDDKYAVYGFGAKIPPTQTVCSDCFALTGDFWDPEVKGVEGIIRAYRRALHVCRFHGQSHLHEVVKVCADLSRPYAEARTPNDNNVDMKYFVFFILTDGQIHQQQRVVDELMKVVLLPMSIFIIGIGDEDFTFLRNLAEQLTALRAASPQDEEPPKPSSAQSRSRPKEKKKGPEAPKAQVPPRGIVHFVCFNEYRDRPADLAAASLQELPREVVGYFGKRKVEPRGLEQFEDDSGLPVRKTIPTSPQALVPASRSRTISRAASGSKSLATISPTVSRASSTLSASERRTDRELKKQSEQLPLFLQEARTRLVVEAERLGYDKLSIHRAFRSGVPAATFEVLVDNILHGAHSGASYREVAEAAVPEPVGLELHIFGDMLPGQVNQTGSMLSSLTDDFGFTMDTFGSMASSRLQLATSNPNQLFSSSRFTGQDPFVQTERKSSVTSLASDGSRLHSILKAEGPRFSGTKETVTSSGSLREAAWVHFQDAEGNFQGRRTP